MASQPVAGSDVLEWSSFVRGHHIYCEDWTPTIGEILTLKVEPDNSHYEYAVAVMKNSMVVGHVPRPVSRVVPLFAKRGPQRGL